MKRAYKLILLSLSVGSLLAVTFQVKGQDVTKFLRPEVARTQGDGGVFYQPIALRSTDLRFFERDKQLSCYSDVLDFDIDKDDKEHLSAFGMVLRAKPQWKVAQGVRHGLDTGRVWTVYNDLNGDSILDTMTKISPEVHQTYILHKNSWIRVGNSKAKWSYHTQVVSVETKDKYVFSKETGWEPIK